MVKKWAAEFKCNWTSIFGLWIFRMPNNCHNQKNNSKNLQCHIKWSTVEGTQGCWCCKDLSRPCPQHLRWSLGYEEAVSIMCIAFVNSQLETSSNGNFSGVFGHVNWMQKIIRIVKETIKIRGNYNQVISEKKK